VVQGIHPAPAVGFSRSTENEADLRCHRSIKLLNLQKSARIFRLNASRGAHCIGTVAKEKCNEVQGMGTLQQEVEDNRKNIRHDALTYAVSELVNMHRDEEILICPDFQRLFRWTRVQQTSFIESLLLEIPVPPLFFFERNDGKWELLDGVQRISTLIKFIGSGQDVPPEYRDEEHNDDDWHEEHQNDLDIPLQLIAGEYLSHLDGMTYIRLPTPLQLNLKRSRLSVYVLKRETHEVYKYEVFKRLHTGGLHFEEQEIRNCSIRLLSNEFPNFPQKVATYEIFRSVLGLSGELLRNGYIEELALRFFAMKNKGGELHS
jgi:hypothetical protein